MSVLSGPNASNGRLKVIVHVKDKQIDVQCGPGTQSLRWLANVAISRYDAMGGVELGVPKGLRTEGGVSLDMTKSTKEILKDGDQVFLQLKSSDEDDKVGTVSTASKPAK